MIRILFLTHSLGGGGAERVLVNLVNHMDKTKFNITVRTLFSDGVNRDMLDDDIHYECNNTPCFRGITYIFRLIPASVLYKHFIKNEKYDVVVAYMHGIPAKVVSGCKSKTTKTVSWLHFGNPEKSSFFDCWLSKKKSFKAYASFSAVVGVSQSVVEAFSDYTGIKDNLRVLYNTNDTEKILKMSKEQTHVAFDRNIKTVCSVGRLAKQKGYDRLINAAQKLHEEGFSFKILILGQGSQKNELLEQIKKCNAGEYVELLGFCENPYSIMVCTDAYISSSREEGLATVLTEALTLGLPVVTTNVSGAKEVLGDNNEYGLVVENSDDGIYYGLKQIMLNDDMLTSYRKKARERSKFFDTYHTVNLTEKFFEELLVHP